MSSKAKALSKRDGEKFLRQAFAQQQAVLLTQLELAARSITHDGKYGEVTERHFINILRCYLPFRYQIDSAIVIDSDGRTSDQIDVVIYDRHYTPTLLDQHDHKYVPAEAVHAVFEIKPAIDAARLKYAGRKAESVRRLHRTSVPVLTRTGEVPAAPLFHIVAGIIAPRATWRDGLGASFERALGDLNGKRQIDCGIALEAGAFDRFDPKGGLEITPPSHCLISFLFRLLRKLQSQATVPAVAWDAYGQNFKH